MTPSQSSFPVFLLRILLYAYEGNEIFGVVGEDEEVSIGQVADAIVKAMGFEGEYTVSPVYFPTPPVSHICFAVRYNQGGWPIPETGL